jgi:glutamate synthase domain-containing protein 2
MPAADITPDLEKYRDSIIPFLVVAEIDAHKAALKKSRLVAIEYSDAVQKDLPGLMSKIKKLSKALVIIRVPAVQGVEDIVAKLAQDGAEIVHIAADYRGRELGSAGAEGRLLKDIIRAVHLRLLEDRIRDEVTIIASGGIAMAEYVPKAMLCGADLTAIDMPLMIALGARLYEEPEVLLIFPEGLGKIPTSILTQRMVNLIGAWHSQILEMMGAMGIREARRLRGESGRAIFFEEIDRDTFGKIFKKEKQ